MKRLFALKNTSTGEIIAGLYFNNKMLAKLERNTRNLEAGSMTKYVITKGPDHNDVLRKKSVVI